MFTHSTNTASFFSVLMAALIYSLYLAGVAWAQGNTSLGINALGTNTTGSFNTAIGLNALFNNATGTENTAIGVDALFSNTTGDDNTAIGVNALANNTTGIENTAIGVDALFNNTKGEDNTAIGVNALANNTTGDGNTAIGLFALVSSTTGLGNTAIGISALQGNTTGNFNTAIGRGADIVVGRNLTNATAIGNGAIVTASNKIRLGDANVTMIEGPVAFSNVSDKTKKENFQPVDGDAVLEKIRGFELSSWNFIGHDPKEFRHYGPMAQDFFAAFRHDGVGRIGSET